MSAGARPLRGGGNAQSAMAKKTRTRKWKTTEERSMMRMLPSVPGGNSATTQGEQLCTTKIRALSQASHFTLLQHARSGAAPSFSTTGNQQSTMAKRTNARKWKMEVNTTEIMICDTHLITGGGLTVPLDTICTKLSGTLVTVKKAPGHL